MAPRRQGSGGQLDIGSGGAVTGAAARCCVPGECVRVTARLEADADLVAIEESVRVICNNDACPFGRFMHRECFDQWEQRALAYLKSCGRARSWSDRQCHQNLWTKKGYDLAFKACGCRCGRGHLKKDPEWAPPAPRDEDKKRRRRQRSTRSSAAPALPDARPRAESLSSSGSSSPPSTSSDPGASPSHLHSKKNGNMEIVSQRVRSGAGANGIFSRRLDFSTFNQLPRHKLNSYHIKMEDEGNHGNDDTRCFILSTLAGHHKSKVTCALCDEIMFVFDRYPLVDGTFFLSPRQHTKGAVEVKVEGRTQFLTCVCMGCLERCSPDRTICCRFCGQKWDGSSLVIGTMYSYDIFMATPCCTERMKCINCFKPLLHPQQRLNFYSDYSHPVTCQHCCTVDTHFVKPLAYCFTKQTFPLYRQWP